MKNKIYHITRREYNNIYFDERTNVIIFDPSVIHTWNDFAAFTANSLDFPSEVDNKIPNVDQLLDWITDLSWYSQEMKFAVVFLSFSEFMKDDLTMKSLIMEIFADDILPFWDDEVERVVVDGKKREFNVYCVD